MVTLPSYPPRRAWLRSFCLLMSLSVGVLISALLSLQLSSSWWFAAGMVSALVLAVSGWLRPEIVSFPYRGWNKLAREFARYGSLWLMGICFYIIFITVGRVGSSLRLAHPTTAGMLWMPRETNGPAAWHSQQGVSAEESSRKDWVFAFLSWTIRSGNWWACCLLPFLMLLSSLEVEGEKSNFPADIYTLF